MLIDVVFKKGPLSYTYTDSKGIERSNNVDISFIDPFILFIRSNYNNLKQLKVVLQSALEEELIKQGDEKILNDIVSISKIELYSQNVDYTEEYNFVVISDMMPNGFGSDPNITTLLDKLK